MGMLGMHGNLAPNVMTNECDVLIAVGMRFDDRVTGKLSAYAPQAKVIHFDIDPAEINKTIKADVPVLGDCRRTLAAVNKLLKSAKHTEWINSFAPYKEKENAESHPSRAPSFLVLPKHGRGCRSCE
jgi:acetolactate synthase-1/2/3 large subunit